MNHPKRQFANNYASCYMPLRYAHGFTDQQTTVDVDCTCITEIVCYVPTNVRAMIFSQQVNVLFIIGKNSYSASISGSPMGCIHNLI